jgi:NTP pyrophosphatase (non-canonical NTP hydrolase)
MDREKFVEELHKMDPDYNPGYVKRPTEIDDVMQACIDHAKNNYMRDDNMYQFAVVIEEMAELTQELTKMLRGRDNRTGVVEELADVQLCVWVTMKMLGITDEEINQAIQVKSDRQRNKKCKKKSNNVPKELAVLYTEEFKNGVKYLSDFDKKAIRTILDRDEWSVRQLPALSSDSDSDKLAFAVNVLGDKGRGIRFDRLKSMIIESKFINFNRYTFEDKDECELILTEYRKIIEDCIFDIPVLRAAIKRMFYLLNL